MRIIQALSSSGITACAVERSDGLPVRCTRGGKAVDSLLGEWVGWVGGGSTSLGRSLAGGAKHRRTDGLDPLVWLGIIVTDTRVEVLPAINATEGWILGLQAGDGRLDGGGVNISAAVVGAVEYTHDDTRGVPASRDDAVVGAGILGRAEARVELSVVPRYKLGAVGGNSLGVEVEV